MKACSFVLESNNAFDTLEGLGVLIKERKIQVTTLHMHRYRNGHASIVVQCEMGADQITRISMGLEEIDGVMELTRMIER